MNKKKVKRIRDSVVLEGESKKQKVEEEKIIKLKADKIRHEKTQKLDQESQEKLDKLISEQLVPVVLDDMQMALSNPTIRSTMKISKIGHHPKLKKLLLLIFNDEVWEFLFDDVNQYLSKKSRSVTI